VAASAAVSVARSANGRRAQARRITHGDNDYRVQVVEPICELVRFLGEEIDRHNPAEWYARASTAVRQEIESCPIYEYVEIMP
jgi:hypothetical protein